MPFATIRNGKDGSGGSRPPRSGGSAGGGILFRILSAVLFLPPFVLITRTGALPFALLVGAIALLATWEMYRLLAGGTLYSLLPFGLLGAAVSVGILYRGSLEQAFLFISLFFVIALLSLLVRRGASPFTRAAGAGFVLLYASVLPGFLILTRELPGASAGRAEYAEGASFIFFLFLVVWGCDTGAYTVGRLLGRRPLALSISPKKTVEGAAGGLVFAVLGALAARAWLIRGLGLADAVIVGLVGGALAQSGDLIESMLKREAGVKDSGPLIPGHGGVLDRFDSIFLAAPFVYAYLRIVVLGGR